MRVGFLAAIALVSASPAAATTFLLGYVQVGVDATIGTETTAEQSYSQLLAPAPVQVGNSAQAFATEGATNYEITSSASTSATWYSAEAGNVLMQWSWRFETAGLDAFVRAQTNLVSPNWYYQFTASGDGMFTGYYNVSASGQKFGLGPIYGTDDLAFGPYGGDVFDPEGSGNFSFALVNGQTYSIGLRNNGNINSGSGFDAFGSASATVSWNIEYTEAVPEPASWAMLIAGFGLVGAASRRQRRSGYADHLVR